MRKAIALFVALAFTSLSQTADAQTVQAGIFKTNDGLVTVKATPSGDFNNASFTYVQFTIRWPSDSGITLGNVTNTSYGVSKDGGEQTTGGYTYQRFAATPNESASWTANEEYELVQFEATGSGPLELAPNGTMPGNGDWYIELDGDATNYSDPFYANNAHLPVELASFEATLDGNAALLHWETASETNNAGFEIQKRAHGRKDAWEKIAFVEGAGTTIEAQRYQYRLKELDPGQHRFRLKQMDFDGGFEYYSAEVKVSVEASVKGGGPLTVKAAHPNPFRQQTTLRFAVQQAQPVRVALYNALGQRVTTLYDGTPAAQRTQTVHIDGTDLPSGIYLVRMTSATVSSTQLITHVR